MSPTQEAWLWSRDCFKILPFTVMQRLARVRQRQVSYWLGQAYNRTATSPPVLPPGELYET